MAASSVSLLALSIFMWDQKRDYGGHFGIVHFYKSFLFSVICLGTLYKKAFRVCEAIGIARFHVISKKSKKWYSGHLDVIIRFRLLALRIGSSCVRFVDILCHCTRRGVFESFTLFLNVYNYMQLNSKYQWLTKYSWLILNQSINKSVK